MIFFRGSMRDPCAAKGAPVFRWGVAKLVKAPDFDSGIRRFESFLPSHFIDGQAAWFRLACPLRFQG
jgi:hypothetical protein